jgi:hypothetical protein
MPYTDVCCFFSSFLENEYLMGQIGCEAYFRYNDFCEAELRFLLLFLEKEEDYLPFSFFFSNERKHYRVEKIGR